MQSIRKYIRVYIFQTRIAFKLLGMFRINAIGMMLSTTLWSLLIFSTIFLTTRNVRTVFGYTPNELLALGAVQVVFLGFFHTIFAKNMDRLPEVINRGQLDSILLKPMDDQYSISFGLVYPSTLVRVVIGALALTYLALSGLIVVPSVWNIFFFFGLLTASELLIYSVWFMIATSLIWFPTMENIIELLYNFNMSSRYPYEFYREIGIAVALLTFPFSIALMIPLKALMGRATVGEICTLLISTVIFLFLSRKLWKWSLRHYTSASN